MVIGIILVAQTPRYHDGPNKPTNACTVTIDVPNLHEQRQQLPIHMRNQKAHIPRIIAQVFNTGNLLRMYHGSSERLAHRSQTSDPSDLPVGWRERAAQIGAPVSLGLAEAFTVLQVG